jgi:hypothetical protein
MRAPLRLIPAALALALPLLPVAAGAQGIVRPQQQPQQQAAPAPALPGLAARRAPAPIPGESTANLSPNAALFDAISRGDLAAARDAVARGANLESRNALGLSPVDAAVDQGRHEIAFYLLSSRDLSRGGSAPPPPAVASLGGPPPAAVAGLPSRREAPPAGSAAQGAAAAIAAAAGAPPPAQRSARLWAGDGGMPRPDIGFLGFDAGRPAGAEPPPLASPPARRPGRS